MLSAVANFVRERLARTFRLHGKAPELRGGVAQLSEAGWKLATTFMADPSNAAPESSLGVLRGLVGRNDPLLVLKEDLDFIEQSIRSLVGIAGAQLKGAGKLYEGQSAILAHPLATLVRGVAEAAGRTWWLLEPWLALPTEDPSTTTGEWIGQSRRVVVRARLLLLDTWASKRRRVEVTYGTGSNEHSEADAGLTRFRSALTTLHQSDAQLKVTGDRSSWRVAGEKLPKVTDLVTAATEYAYGERFVGSGMNPYPVYSGFAHASLELALGPPSSPGPSLERMVVEPDEALVLAGVALRSFAVAYELAAVPLGRTLDGLKSWEREVDALIVVAD